MIRARQSQSVPVAEVIDEEGDIESQIEDYELETIPDDLLACNKSQTPITQDENLINTRIVNEGVTVEKEYLTGSEEAE